MISNEHAGDLTTMDAYGGIRCFLGHLHWTRLLVSAIRSLAWASALALCACASLPRVEFSAQEQRIAEVPGYAGIRAWGDDTLEDFLRSGVTLAAPGERRTQYLALSGGGSGGAFGAGVLVGWTARGTRPIFTLVSGVSTGALIAPFAFLGAAYDHQLNEIYTSGVASSIVEIKAPLAGFLGSGFLRPEPLRNLVERYATDELMQAIAREHRKGRRLFVVTTNLDAQRPVVWDMGKIAASGRADALKLFRDILVASTSIPVAFPPVLIDVEAAGHHFQEMHADGATSTEVFTVPEGLLATATFQHLPKGTKANLYVLINNTLSPEFKVIDNSTLSVGARALGTLIKAQTRSSLDAVYAFSRQAGIDFHIASIERDVPYDAADPFNVSYMRTLFKLGYEETLAGRVWNRAPLFLQPEGSKLSHTPNAALVAKHDGL